MTNLSISNFDHEEAAQNFLLLFLLIVPVLYVLNYIVDTGLRKSKLRIYTQWNDVYNSKVNADVLLCGSSRTLIQISPAIIDSILHLNSYNLGMNGWTFNMQYAIFKIYLQHNIKPKYVIQNVDFSTFGRRTDLYEYEQFLPYIHDTIIQKVTNECKGKFTIPEMYFPLFKYNNHFDLIKEGINCYFNTGKQYVSHSYKGFEYNDLKWDSSFAEFKKANPKGVYTGLSEKTLKEFEEFLEYCKKSNIQVIFEFAPIYYEELLMENNLPKLMKTIKNYSEKYNIVFLDYSKDSLCYDKRFFYNSQHLNTEGTKLFSAKLATDIKAIIDPHRK